MYKTEWIDTYIQASVIQEKQLNLRSRILSKGHQRIYTLWSHSYEIIETVKLWRESDLWLVGTRGNDKGMTAKYHKETFGMMEMSYTENVAVVTWQSTSVKTHSIIRITQQILWYVNKATNSNVLGIFTKVCWVIGTWIFTAVLFYINKNLNKT